MARQNASLRRIAASDAEPLAGQIVEPADASILTDDELGGEIAIGVAHAERERLATRALFDAHVRERRVPGDVDVPRDELFDLPLVVREQREIERHALLAKIIANALPDRDDLRIVRDR